MGRNLKIFTINPKNPEPGLITRAVEIAGKAVPFIFPTDTVYGIGIAVVSDSSLEPLYAIKERDWDKAIPWLVSGVRDLEIYGAEVPDYALKLAEKHWPGALTLIVKASDAVPEKFRATDGSIALRVPNCKIALAMIEELGAPLATSSANLQGKEPPRCFRAIDTALMRQVELVIDGGECPKWLSSTIVSCLGEEPQIVRLGALSEAELRQ